MPSYRLWSLMSALLTVTVCTTDPSIRDVPDQLVFRNTLTPRSVVVEVDVPRAPPGFTMSLTSSDPELIPARTLTCDVTPCTVELTPPGHRDAHVSVTLTARWDDVEAQTSFDVAVQAQLVTAAGDDGVDGDLRTLLEGAIDGDVFGFDVEGTFSTPQVIDLQSPIALDTTVTLEGPGPDMVSIRGESQHAIFQVTGDTTLREVELADAFQAITVVPPGNLTLVQTRLRDHTGTDGSAVLNHGGQLDIVGCEFVGNVSTGEGGAVRHMTGDLQIAESTFRGNRADVGGALATTAASQVLIHDSTFSDNDALTTAAGAMVAARTVSVSETSFVDHRSNGAFVLTIDAVEGTLSDLQLSRNNVPTGVVGLDRGVFDITALDVRDNVGDACTVADGIGLSVAQQAQVDLTDSAVVNNHCAQGRVAGVAVAGILTATSLEIRGNSGGGLRVHDEGVATLLESEVSGNGTLTSGGGIQIAAGAEVTLDDGTVVAENQANDGAGVHVSSSTLVVGRAVIGADGDAAGNEATSYGGGIYCVRSKVTLSDETEVNGNTTFSADGGGLFQTTGCTVDLKGATVRDNYAATWGGGLYIQGGIVEASTNVTITENGAYYGGPGISYENALDPPPLCDFPLQRVFGNEGTSEFYPTQPLAGCN